MSNLKIASIQCAINADGSHLRQLTTGIDPALSPEGQWVAFTSPAFSPDGSKIAVAYWQGDHWDIQVMPAPGTQAQMNTDGSNQHPLFPAGALGGLTLQYHNVDERVMSWR